MAVIKMNVEEFNLSIQKFAKKLVPTQFGVFIRALAMKVLRGVVKKTPVDTGRARANWQLNVGEITDRELESLDRNGAPTVTKGLSALADLRNNGIGQIIYIYNNVPYILDLESGDGSAQAPHGMVGVTLAEIAAGF